MYYSSGLDYEYLFRLVCVNMIFAEIEPRKSKIYF